MNELGRAGPLWKRIAEQFRAFVGVTEAAAALAADSGALLVDLPRLYRDLQTEFISSRL